METDCKPAALATAVAGFAMLNSLLSAQSHTCPDNPTWSGIACSAHEALQPGDGGEYHLTYLLERSEYRDYAAVKGESAARLRLYRHFDDMDRVADWVADAWAAQHPVLRRMSMPLMIGVDVRSRGIYLPRYVDTPEARRIVEMPESHVHERIGVLDEAFEELLAHEMCHAVDHRLEDAAGTWLSGQEEWTGAAASDGAHVTDYAETNGREDFAETCAAFFLTQPGNRLPDGHRSHIASRVPARLAYLAATLPADPADLALMAADVRWSVEAVLDDFALPVGRLVASPYVGALQEDLNDRRAQLYVESVRCDTLQIRTVDGFGVYAHERVDDQTVRFRIKVRTAEGTSEREAVHHRRTGQWRTVEIPDPGLALLRGEDLAVALPTTRGPMAFRWSLQGAEEAVAQVCGDGGRR